MGKRILVVVDDHPLYRGVLKSIQLYISSHIKRVNNTTVHGYINTGLENLSCGDSTPHIEYRVAISKLGGIHGTGHEEVLPATSFRTFAGATMVSVPWVMINRSTGADFTRRRSTNLILRFLIETNLISGPAGSVPLYFYGLKRVNR
jgi:hypothetical protein